MADGRELGRELGLYGRLVGARIRADWQYRTSFVLFLVGQALVATSDLAGLAVIFDAVGVLAGWRPAEVALLFGLSGVSFALADVFISPVERCSVHIKAGTFDGFLIRPAGALLQLLASEFALRRLGRLVLPVPVTVVALGLVDVAWTPAAVAMVAMALVCGAVIYGSLWIVTASIAFWAVESEELANIVIYGGDLVTQYPVDVFGPWLRRMVTFVVPLASVAYLPAAWLLGKRPALGLPAAAAWTAPLVALATGLLARAVWRTAIRHYRSTGS